MFDAVLFDLFTALLDSQPLWREVAGSAAVGARWREECSRLAYSAEPYRESVQIGVVTNCSEELGQRAAARVGVHFDTVGTAEAAGAYKPRPEPYRLALDRLGVEPSRALFVAGSPADITGAAGAGMRVWWHNRLQLPLGERQAPLAEHDSLEPLLTLAIERDLLHR